MIKVFKAYHLFIPGAYKPLKMILLYFVEPVILFFLTQLGAYEYTGLVFGGCLLATFGVEAILDMVVFGGIQRKTSRQTVFLRMPANGLWVLKYGLLGDFLRRVYVVLIPGILAVLYVGEDANVSLSRAVLISFVALLSMELVLFIIRFFDNVILNILVTSFSFGGITGAAGVIVARLGYTEKMVNKASEFIIAGVFAALCVAVYLIRSKIALKKAKEGYYE